MLYPDHPIWAFPLQNRGHRFRVARLDFWPLPRPGGFLLLDYPGGVASGEALATAHQQLASLTPGQEGEHGPSIVAYHMTDAPPSIVTCSTERKIAHHLPSACDRFSQGKRFNSDRSSPGPAIRVVLGSDHQASDIKTSRSLKG